MNPSKTSMVTFMSSLITDVEPYHTYSNFGGVQLDDHFACPSVFQTCSKDLMTSLARSISAAVRAAGIDIELSPATLSFSETNLNVDWASWMSEGLFDYVVPQLYTADANIFAKDLRESLNVCTKESAKFIAGLRVDGTGSSTPWASVAQQITDSNSEQVGVSIWYSNGLLNTYKEQFQKLWGKSQLLDN